MNPKNRYLGVDSPDLLLADEARVNKLAYAVGLGCGLGSAMVELLRQGTEPAGAGIRAMLETIERHDLETEYNKAVLAGVAAFLRAKQE